MHYSFGTITQIWHVPLSSEKYVSGMVALGGTTFVTIFQEWLYSERGENPNTEEVRRNFSIMWGFAKRKAVFKTHKS